MGMKLGIGFAAGVMVELRHENPGSLLAHTTRLAPARPGGGAFQMLGRGQDGGAVDLFDGSAILSLESAQRTETDLGALKVIYPNRRNVRPRPPCCTS